MRLLKREQKVVKSLGLVLLLVLATSTAAFAQGSIFGTVTNSNASTPANGEISFIGYLDNTDEEVRIESADGAGYDAGNWFDDFQNYLTEAPGNPYDYHFFNTVNGEGFQLSGAIPNNSFQQENVALAPVAWPAAPVGLAGITVSGSSVVLSWTRVPGLTYHVYRRLGTSNGSFFRRDDPTGSLANPGVANNYFVDNTVDGVSSYSYMIIAQNALGNLSSHSAAVTVNTAAIDAPVLSSIDPTTGTASGGTVVTVTGSGFDPAGAQVYFGASPVTATAVTPFQLTVAAPPGLVGAVVDVTVLNVSSGLSSNTLVGGFSYAPNAAPELAAIGPRSVTENQLLQFSVSATDLDGDTPLLSTSTRPAGAAFVDNNNGTGQFTWTPDFTDAGVYSVTFYASDAVTPTAIDSEVVQITVLDAGNQPPVMTAINDTTVAEGGNLALVVSASDADGEIPTLSATGLPANATFDDNANGTGNFSFSPDFTQAGVYLVVFKATDVALDVDSIVVQITVTNVNQLPVLTAIGPQTGTENVLLSFLISAADPDGIVPVLTAAPLPGTAQLTDSLNGVGLFQWTPTFADSGTYVVTFYAADRDFPTAIDSERVTITVLDGGNQAPVLTPIAPHFVAEGGNLIFAVEAADPDGTFPALRAENLPANAAFTDNANGTGSFQFNPDFNQAGLYSVTFIADDGGLADSILVDITVTEAGNMPPVFAPIADTSINEGQSLVIAVSATDPDGGATFPSLSISTGLTHYTFVDNGNGTGTLTYNPTYLDAGADTVNFLAIDYGAPQRTTTEAVVVTTVDVNQPPVIRPLGPFTVAVGDPLQFTVLAVDSTDPIASHRVLLTALGLPANATFVDNGNSTGTFNFQPDATQVGLRQVSFVAIDQGTPQLSTTRVVDITVVTENQPPVIASIPPQIITEGDLLTINVSASDPDGAPPSLEASNAPEGSTFVDNGDGTGVFTYIPGFYGRTRLTSVTFRAFDGMAVDRELVLIQINDAGNQAPYFDSIPTPSLVEGETLTQVLSASDPDGDALILAVDPSPGPLPPNAAFTDNGDSTGTFTFTPDFSQAGLYDIYLIAYDGPIDGTATLSDSIVMTVSVIEFGNHAPELDSITNRTTQEDLTLTINVTADDLDGDSVVLYTGVLPANASFVDNYNGTGALTFSPDRTQQGTITVWFYASDLQAADSQAVTITVLDVNYPPLVFTGANPVIYEGDTLRYTVESSDADGTIPFLKSRLSGLDTLATNMTFADTRDGFGTLTFIPGPSQGGPAASPLLYRVVFVATDEFYPTDTALSPTVTISVIDRNFAPVISFPGGSGPFTLNEGTTLQFQVQVQDFDWTTGLPTVITQNMPDSNATFTYNSIIGLGQFTFSPNFVQAGTYLVRFIATDDRGARDTADVQINVLDAGNQAPTFLNAPTDTLRVPVGHSYSIVVEAYDPELDSMWLQASPMLPGATWAYNGEGTWAYTFTVDSTYLGTVFELTVVATDYPWATSSTLLVRSIAVSFLRGDLDDDNLYTVNDVAYMISYLFRDGPQPNKAAMADVDNDGSVTISDLSYLIYYMYRSGPAPQP